MNTENRQLIATYFAKRVVARAMELGLPKELYNLECPCFKRRVTTYLTHAHEDQTDLFYISELNEYVQKNILSMEEKIVLYICDDSLEMGGAMSNYTGSLEWVYNHKEIVYGYGNDLTVIKVPTITETPLFCMRSILGYRPSFEYRVIHKNYPYLSGKSAYLESAITNLISNIKEKYPDHPIEGIPYLSN